MKKQILLSALTGLIIATGSYAQPTSYDGKITKIQTPPDKGYAFIYIDKTSKPAYASCNKYKRFIVQLASGSNSVGWTLIPNGQAAYAAALSAQMSGKKVRIRADNVICDPVQQEIIYLTTYSE